MAITLTFRHRIIITTTLITCTMRIINSTVCHHLHLTRDRGTDHHHRITIPLITIQPIITRLVLFIILTLCLMLSIIPLSTPLIIRLIFRTITITVATTCPTRLPMLGMMYRPPSHRTRT